MKRCSAAWLLVLLALAAPGWAAPRARAQRGPRSTSVRAAALAEAIARARAGDTLVVLPGVYSGPTIVVDRPVVILGRPGAVLDGGGTREIMDIHADDVVVRGLTLRRVGVSFLRDQAAIRTDSVRGCVIEGNRIEDAFFGIYLARTAACRVAGNTIVAHGRSESLSGNGIHAWYSRDVDIVDNRVAGHRDGIYLEFVASSRLSGNVSERNLRYGLHFMFSDSCTYRRNVFRGNMAGVAVMYTRHVVMEANRFQRNWGSSAYGLLLKDISDSRIVGNAFEDNTVGVYAEGSDRLVVERNRFVRNGWALRVLGDCEGGVFARNDFVGNTFDVATNSRSSFNRFAGNYWDRYRGYDLGRDGVGDVPYHPVRLFSLMVEQTPQAIVLLRSLFASLLDAAEEAFPTISPEAVVDPTPSSRPIAERQS